ncbi:MAG: hypothetical protein IT461_14020 [Planctomycetes bacterium]|nr:hypothetical protein [Planctomycetota bacterium]
MPEQESKRIKWEPRDVRDWEVLCAEEDQLTARLVCTFLEANAIAARVGSRQGRFTVEVPVEQLVQARSLHGEDPSESNLVNLPPLQEVSTVRSSQTTVRRIRAELVKRGMAEQTNERKPRSVGVLILALVAALLAAAVLLFRQLA